MSISLQPYVRYLYMFPPSGWKTMKIIKSVFLFKFENVINCRGGLWRLLPGVHVHIQGLRGGHPRPGLDGRPQECWRGLREERGKLKGLYRDVFKGVVPMNQWILRALDPNNGCWATCNPPWKAKINPPPPPWKTSWYAPGCTGCTHFSENSMELQSMIYSIIVSFSIFHNV